MKKQNKMSKYKYTIINKVDKNIHIEDFTDRRTGEENPLITMLKKLENINDSFLIQISRNTKNVPRKESLQRATIMNTVREYGSRKDITFKSRYNKETRALRIWKVS